MKYCECSAPAVTDVSAWGGGWLPTPPQKMHEHAYVNTECSVAAAIGPCKHKLSNTQSTPLEPGPLASCVSYSVRSRSSKREEHTDAPCSVAPLAPHTALASKYTSLRASPRIQTPQPQQCNSGGCLASKQQAHEQIDPHTHPQMHQKAEACNMPPRHAPVPHL